MLNIFKSAVAPVAENETPELAALANTEIEVALANEYHPDGATAVEVQKIPMGVTAKKAAAQGAKLLAKKAREAKAAEKAAKVEAAPVVAGNSTAIAETSAPSWGDYKDTTQTAPVVAAPVAAPAKVSDSIAARKALYDATVAEIAVEDRKARVIELLSRPEGATLQEIQVYCWLAAVAVRRIVEKAGYTTSQSETRPFRYFLRSLGKAAGLTMPSSLAGAELIAENRMHAGHCQGEAHHTFGKGSRIPKASEILDTVRIQVRKCPKLLRRTAIGGRTIRHD